MKKLTMSESGSSLPTALQELICLIFDVDQMRRTMLEFEVSRHVTGCFVTFAL